MKETLSDKIEKRNYLNNDGTADEEHLVPVENLKEAIKELKEQFPNSHPIEEEIQKIFGNKLTGGG